MRSIGSSLLNYILILFTGVMITLLVVITFAEVISGFVITNSTYLSKRSGGSGASCSNCEGCELVRLEDQPDLSNFQFPSAAGTPGTNAATQQKLGNTFKKFVSLAVGISHLVPPPFGPYFRAGHGIFTSALALIAKGSKTTEWEKIERKVEAKIEQYLTYDHFKDLSSYWLDLFYMTTKCPEELTREDLKDVVKMKSAMFPQNNADVTFTPNWISVINGWLMNVAAVYLELIRQNKLPQCALAEEMAELREDVIGALKTLQIKRWRSIRGHDYENGAGSHYTYARLQYKDEVTGDLFPAVFNDEDHEIDIQDTKDKIFKKIRDATVRITDPLRIRFNKLLDALEDSFEGCDAVGKIPWQESFVDYPENCFGKPMDDSDSKCLLPCEMYGYGSYWCPNEDALKRYGEGSQAGKIHGGNNNADCNRPNWTTCYPIKEAKRSRFFDAPWKHGVFKKKKKTNKKSAEKEKAEKKSSYPEEETETATDEAVEEQSK